MRKAVYIFLFIFFGILIYYFVKGEINKSNSISKKVLVIYKHCQKGTKFSHKSLIKVKYMGKTYPVAINKTNCKNLVLNDSINLLYSEEGDRFFFND